MSFISNKKHECPICGNPIHCNGVNTDHIDDGRIYIPWWCLECKVEGEEWYEASFIGHGNVIADDGVPTHVYLDAED